MNKREELIQGGQGILVSAIRDIINASTLEEVQEIITQERLLDIAEAVASTCEDNVDRGLEIMDICKTLAEEAGETLDFLVRRNASRESIAGMSVIIYHANKLHSLGSDVATTLEGTVEAGL